MVLVLVNLMGCIVADDTVSYQFDGSDVTRLEADIERGDLDYHAVGGTDIEVLARSWATANEGDKAATKQSGNDFDATVDGDTLELWADVQFVQAGVDFEIEGPIEMDTEIDLSDGTAHLIGLEGVHTIRADRIVTEELAGDAFLEATDDGIDAEIWPYDDGDIVIDSTYGDVVLRLPWGADYDLVVWGDDSYEMEIADLGLENEMFGAGYYEGSYGTESITVTVNVTGGSFTLLESFDD